MYHSACGFNASQYPDEELYRVIAAIREEGAEVTFIRYSKPLWYIGVKSSSPQEHLRIVFKAMPH
jgi:hypothetical protein